MHRRSHSEAQNSDVKSFPRSETISAGSPCCAKISRRKTRASSGASMVLSVGMNRAILVRRSTTTRTQSKPSESGRPSMKSMEERVPRTFGNGKEAEGTVGLVPDRLRSTAFRAGRDVVLDVYGDLWPPIATTDSLESLRDSGWPLS